MRKPYTTPVVTATDIVRATEAGYLITTTKELITIYHCTVY
jgi:hypothetical protein